MIINKLSELSITLCVLNEELNVAGCIKSLLKEDPFEIIVIDGGSNDKTIDILKKLPVRLIQVEKKGLAFQRNIGVKASKTKYTAIIDADHRIEENALNKLVIEMTKLKYDGIEAQIFSLENSGYWDYAMEQNFVLTHNYPGLRRMIGTPCVYKTEVIKKNNFDPRFTGPSDDTDLCYRLHKLNYKLGVGTSKVFQIHRSNFFEFKNKFIWYGKGDAQFVWHHKERTLSIIKHITYNYPIKKSFFAIKNKKINLVPFFLLCGVFRSYGFFKEIIKMILGKRADNEIYKT